MLTVYKQPLPAGPGTFEFSAPADAVMLDVQLQNGAPVLWYLCDPDTPKIHRRVVTWGTGTPFPGSRDVPGLVSAGRCYVKTYQLNGFVWHVFADYQGN